MPSPQASPLHVSPLQQELLQRMVHRTTNTQRLVKRGQIILEAIKGTSNTRIAQLLQVDYETVRRWRDRWRVAESRLQAIEATGKQKLLSQAITGKRQNWEQDPVWRSFLWRSFFGDVIDWQEVKNIFKKREP